MSGPLLLPTWALLSDSHPDLVATMRRYLEQVACVLRPGSVNGADLALRSFATFVVENAPEVISTAQVTRRHVEEFKPWFGQTSRSEQDQAHHRHPRASTRDAADVLRPHR